MLTAAKDSGTPVYWASQCRAQVYPHGRPGFPIGSASIFHSPEAQLRSQAYFLTLGMRKKMQVLEHCHALKVAGARCAAGTQEQVGECSCGKREQL